MRRWQGVKVAATAGHAAVRFLFAEAARQRLPLVDLSERSGVGMQTLLAWKKDDRKGRKLRREPRVGNLEAALNVLGYRLVAARHA